MPKKRNCEICENRIICRECKHDCCKCPMFGCTYTKGCEAQNIEKYAKKPKYRTIGPLPKV